MATLQPPVTLGSARDCSTTNLMRIDCQALVGADGRPCLIDDVLNTFGYAFCGDSSAHDAGS